MIEYILNVLVGAGIGSGIAILFYKIFTKKYEKLLNFANEMIEKMQNDNNMSNELQRIADESQENDNNMYEKSEIEEIDEEIRQLRKQIITVKDPRMYNFLREKIKYLEHRKRGILKTMQYGLPSRYGGNIPNIDLSQIDMSKLPNPDQLSDEELLALAKQFEPLIPRQFRQYARNPMLIRMFIKYILPTLKPQEKQEEQKQEQIPRQQIKEGYTVV
jgi:uncharacterized protein YdcH (DUF465 family)